MAKPTSPKQNESALSAHLLAHPELIKPFYGVSEIVGTFTVSLADGRVARLEVEKVLKAKDKPFFAVACFMIVNGAWTRDIVFPWRPHEDAAGALELAMGLLKDRWNLKG